LCIGVVAVELCGREVVRRSLLRAVTGAAPEPWALAAIAAIAAVIVVLLRPRTGAVAPLYRRPALLFAVLFSAGVACQLHLGARLQSDGFYYYAYLRSIAFDGDVDFTNDYRLLGLGDKPHLFQPTPTGHAQSAWTIGPAFVWAPFFAAGHAAAERLAVHDPNVTANGVSFPYRQAVCIAGLFYGLLGSWFSYRLTARYFGRRPAAASTTLVVLGSFMLWYIVKEPSMTHAPSMAAVAGFTWLWAATRADRTLRHWALLGIVAGFMTLIRWQNALFALLPACDAIVALAAAWRRGDRASARGTLAAGLLFTACATAAFLPQMLAWRAIYGGFLAVSPVGPEIRWQDPHLVDILWSSRNGLFAWSPILYFGAVGLMLFAVSRPAAGVPMLLALAAMTYFNAAIQDWWGSAGFGGRRFDGTIPLFCIGVAALAAALAGVVRRHPLRTIAAGGLALVLWNMTLMSGAQDGLVRIGETVSFGDTMAVQARTFHRWFGNPFTYPTSLVWALKNGMPPARYDLLGVNRFLGDPLRQYGSIDIGAIDEWVIGEGWHAHERDGPITFRWASSSAAVLIPLDHAARLKMQLRLRALGYSGAPPQLVTVVVNGRAQPAVPVDTGWHTAELIVPEDDWRAGVNRVQLQFAWAVRPVDVGIGGDTRSLSAQVDYVRVQVIE
jgi:hypothetical protein